jgi:hypothetical protein
LTLTSVPDLRHHVAGDVNHAGCPALTSAIDIGLGRLVLRAPLP